MVVATDWWEVVGALGAAVGGLGAAAGAIAAWRAAGASRDASRDALEALAVGIRPQLVVTYRQLPREAGALMPAPARFVLRVFNNSSWPATNLHLRAVLADGEVIERQLERLEPNPTEPMADFEPFWDVPVRDIDEQWPTRDGKGEHLQTVLSYSDARGIARYEQTAGVNVRGGGINLAVSTSGGATASERRIS